MYLFPLKQNTNVGRTGPNVIDVQIAISCYNTSREVKITNY